MGFRYCANASMPTSCTFQLCGSMRSYQTSKYSRSKTPYLPNPQPMSRTERGCSAWIVVKIGTILFGSLVGISLSLWFFPLAKRVQKTRLEQMLHPLGVQIISEKSG